MYLRIYTLHVQRLPLYIYIGFIFRPTSDPPGTPPSGRLLRTLYTYAAVYYLIVSRKKPIIS